MAKQIFREEALGRLASPEQLDKLMPITHLRGWVALVGIGLVLLVAILWGVLGSVSTTVQGQGVLTRLSGVRTVDARAAGRVGGISVRIGEAVRQDQDLFYLTPTQPGEPIAVTSPVSGRILAIAVAEGEYVDQGAALLVIESLEQPLRAIIFVSVSDGYQVNSDMEVQILPATAKMQESLYLLGRVRSAGKYPATRVAMMRNLQNEEMVDDLLKYGPVLEVVTDLAKDDLLEEIYSGTPCRALITIEKKRPIQLILPIFPSR